MRSDRPRIGVAGMSHLGLVSAAAFAAQGLPVTAFDSDAALVERIGHGDLPVLEPGLPELLARTERPSFTPIASALSACDVVYAALDVPTDDTGESSLGPLNSLLDVIWPALGRETTLVVLSQVPPGFTRALAHSRAAGSDAPVVHYQVETLIFGRAVERALQPERFIVGCADPARPLPARYLDVLNAFGCPVLRMRYESAELAKISINAFLVSSIATTNMLAEICERIGAEWSEVAPALRLDARIGPKAYLAPGLGVGGGNLGRDLETLKRLSDEHGTDTRAIDAWRANSAYRRDWALRVLRRDVLESTPDARLAVWGLAYKEQTTSTKNSPAIALLEALGNRHVTVFDPAARLPAHLRGRHVCAPDPLTACEGADALFVMTPWPQFRETPLDDVARAMRGRTVIDPYGVLEATPVEALGFAYHRLGAPSVSPPC